MTKQVPLQLNTTIANNLPTNNAQLITAALLRASLTPIVDSFSQQNVVQVTTSPYTLLNANYQNLHIVNRGSPTTVNLPVPGAVPNEFLAGWSTFVANIGVGTVTLVPQGGKLINGAASIPLAIGLSANISSDGTNYFAAISVGSAGVANNTASILTIIDNGVSAIPAGLQWDIPLDFNGIINQVTMLADAVGSIVVDIWKDTFAAYPPTVADSITAAAKPTITATLKSQDATLVGWTTVFSAGDTLRFNIDSAATIKRLAMSLKVTKT